MPRMCIEMECPGNVSPSPNNPRKHSKAQVERLAESIRAFGFNVPLLVDAQTKLISGHARLEAAKLLGLTEVPLIRIEHLTEAQRRAFVIADNRIAELSEWDEALLASEFEGLLSGALDFDVGITGFDVPEIDLMLHPVATTSPAEPEPFIEEDDAAPVTVPGDLWILGPHRLLCGDVLDEAAFARVMESERAAMIFTDPPYNVPINGHVCGKGSVKHAEFAMASGEMSEPAFAAFLETALKACAGHSVAGALHYVCMDWRHTFELQSAARAIYDDQINLCVWVKSNGGMGSFYRSRHELVFVYRTKGSAHRNNVQLGRFGRNRTNVWEYAGVNTFSGTRAKDLAAHPTVKPRAMIEDAILDCTAPGAIILDPFGGSGTTLLAADRTSREARLIELEPRYVDRTIRRWEALTGGTARHAVTGAAFGEMTTNIKEAGA